MLRIFSYGNPFFFGLLLVLVFALHWPDLSHKYISDYEGQKLLCAQRAIAAGHLYKDAMDDEPPLLVWFYEAFVGVFGSAALLAIRVFVIVYIYLGALLLNQLYNTYRISGSITSLPAFLYVLSFSPPGYNLPLSSGLLLTLPVLLSFWLLLTYRQEGRNNWLTLYAVGFIGACCILISYQFGLYFLAIIFFFSRLQRVRKHELVSIAGGVIFAFVLFTIYLKLSDTLFQFWDQAVVYPVETLFQSPSKNLENGILEAVFLWGLIGLAAVAGLLLFRGQLSSVNVRTRRVESFMAIWLLTAILSLVLNYRWHSLADFILLLPPLIFYASYFLRRVFTGGWRVLAVAICLLPLCSTGLYFIIDPQSLKLIEQSLPGIGLKMGLPYVSEAKEKQTVALQSYLAAHGVKNVFLLGEDYALYQSLGMSCTQPYTNCEQFVYKLNLTSGEKLNSQKADPITEVSLYNRFEEHPPACIIDREGLFGRMQYNIPLLLSPYRRVQVGTDTLYLWQPKPISHA